MNGDTPGPTRSERPTRKPIVLIGAPSGAGKTVLSQKIIAGTMPFIAELYGGVQAGTPVRHDLRVLPTDLPRDNILIIECATHKLGQLMRTDQWRRMLDVVRESKLVIHVSLDVPRRTVVRQYFFRIFTGPKRMHVLYRVLQVSKYRNTLIYMLTRQLSRSNAAWALFGDQLATEFPAQVVLLHVRVFDGRYRIIQKKMPDLRRPARG